MTLARASIALFVIQFAIVSSIAGKYLYQRETCPKVWTRAVAYDPEMLMRGRYLGAQLRIDLCGVSLPYAKPPLNMQSDEFLTFLPADSSYPTDRLPTIIGARDGKLVILRTASTITEHNTFLVSWRKGAACSDAILDEPVDFYLSEKAKSPFPLAAGQELWVEVTVPPVGPPRPLGLAIKSSDGNWQPLTYR